MYQAMQATELDQQPQLGANVFMAFYFIAFVVLGVFFCLNMVSRAKQARAPVVSNNNNNKPLLDHALLSICVLSLAATLLLVLQVVGIIINKFQEYKKQQGKSVLLSSKQEEWLQIQRL